MRLDFDLEERAAEAFAGAMDRATRRARRQTFPAPGAVSRQTSKTENHAYCAYPPAAKGNLLKSLETERTITESKWKQPTNIG